MSRTFHHGRRWNCFEVGRRFRRTKKQVHIEGIRKGPADLRRLAKAVIELARLEAEVVAEAEHELRKNKDRAGRGSKAARRGSINDEDAT